MNLTLVLQIIFFLLFHAFFAFPSFAKEIKIGLEITQRPVLISTDKKCDLINLSTNRIIQTIGKYKQVKAENINGLIKLSLNQNSPVVLGAFQGPVKVSSGKNGIKSYNNKWYRGEIILSTNNDTKNLTVVNNIELEDYLLSVVPSEIPSKWNKEVLKAQAVAARSYSIGYLGRRKEKGYDLESTIEDQVYLGISSEKKSTSDAVRTTKDLILFDNENNPLITLYHASGGGYTDSIENIWDKKSSPHIQPCPDYDDNSPYFKWFRTYEKAKISEMLKDFKLGEIKDIKPLSRSEANRVKWIKIIGTNGEKKIRGDDFRRALKLPSAKFNLTVENNKIKFAGRGNGHGLGMSQWGAKALAEKGFNYKQILAHYYPGAKLARLVEIKR